MRLFIFHSPFINLSMLLKMLYRARNARLNNYPHSMLFHLFLWYDISREHWLAWESASIPFSGHTGVNDEATRDSGTGRARAHRVVICFEAMMFDNRSAPRSVSGSIPPIFGPGRGLWWNDLLPGLEVIRMHIYISFPKKKQCFAIDW